MSAHKFTIAAAIVASALSSTALAQDLVVRGERVYTMAGAAIENGVVVIEDGKIVAVGPEASTEVPEGYEQRAPLEWNDPEQRERLDSQSIITELGPSLEAFREHFNAERGHVRAVGVFAPT